MAERATQIVRKAGSAGAGLRGIIALRAAGPPAALAHAEEQGSADGGRPIAMIDLASNRVIQAGGFGIPPSPQGAAGGPCFVRECARATGSRLDWAGQAPTSCMLHCKIDDGCSNLRICAPSPWRGSDPAALDIWLAGVIPAEARSAADLRPSFSEGTLPVLPARIAATRRTARRPDQPASGGAIDAAKDVALRHDRLTIRRRPAEPRVSPGESRQGAEILLAIGSAVTR
jgi:hypothetical protein